MKKIIYTLIAVCVTFAVILACSFFSSKHVGNFSILNYTRELTEFSSYIELGEIQNSEEAKNAAEKIWVETFGESVKNKKPYRVSFDEENQIWLVRGSYLLVPGGPHILIQKEDGKVLAVWHDKF